MEATIAMSGVDWQQRRFWAISEIAAVVLVGFAVLAVAGGLGLQDPWARAAAVAVGEAVIIVLVWWSQRRRGLTMANLGLTFTRPRLRDVATALGWSLVVLAGTAALFLAAATMMSAVAGTPQSADVSMYDYLRGRYWAIVATIAVVWVNSSFAEEVIYRGFLIHRLEEVFAGMRRVTPIAVVVGGLIFGAIHFAWGVPGMIQTAVVGMALGAAYVTLGRRLWIVILVHGYLDTLLFVQIYSMGATGS